MSLDLFQLIYESMDRGRKEREREAQDDDIEEAFRRAGETLKDICDTTGLSPDQVRLVMEENPERFEHCRLPGPDATQRDVVLYRLRHNETQPGWEPGVTF